MKAVGSEPIILAIDPGKVTGWAAYRPEPSPVFPEVRFHPGAQHPFASGAVEGRHAFQDWLREVAALGHPLELVIESFTITARTIATDRDMNALYIIGWVDGVAHVNGWPLTLQQPGQAKGFASNEKLAILGWRNPMPGGHADDAARHLLTYLGTKRRDLGDPLLRLLIEGGLS